MKVELGVFIILLTWAKSESAQNLYIWCIQAQNMPYDYTNFIIINRGKVNGRPFVRKKCITFE